MIMCCYNLRFETFVFDDTNNLVEYFIVYAVDDSSDISFVKNFLVSTYTDYEISMFAPFYWVRPYYM